jgi:hypothetical protein
MKQPLERAADHLANISSIFGLELDIIQAAFKDLVTRLEKLEQDNKAAKDASAK